MRNIDVTYRFVDQTLYDEIYSAKIPLSDMVSMRILVLFKVTSDDDEELWSVFSEHKKELISLVEETIRKSSIGLNAKVVRIGKGSVEILVAITIALAAVSAYPGGKMVMEDIALAASKVAKRLKKAIKDAKSKEAIKDKDEEKKEEEKEGEEGDCIIVCVNGQSLSN